MKKKLYDQVLSWHGPMLGLFIEEEQGAFPRDAPATTEDRTSYQVPDSRQAHGQLQSQSKSCGSSAEILPVEFAEKLQRFIARKADLLFMDSGEHVQPSRYEIHVEDSEDEEEEGDLYAILPPLEQFMSIHSETTECRAHLYEALEANDIVVARVVNIRDFGLFVRLICLCCNKKRQVDNLEIIGLCPSSEIPAQSSHENPVNGYHVNDLLKLRVLKVEASEEKILLSLFVPKHWSGDSHVGIITESELPSQYKRSLFLADHNDSYDKMLHNILGFSNPHCVSYLTNMLGLDEKTPPSLLRALH
ncbi:tetratricopeptide repeat protein 14-like, partial [Saccoglossus kowalevskii]|uniref:Tetratricopeptide repeat protein 14-like n=1 Tax=Saccoglossus kowalevskii TaxID=10224 RepID=A0ABM0GZ44_SACKO